MAEIFPSLTSHDFFGFIKVDLTDYWKSKSAVLTANSYSEYKNMRIYLKGIDHKFGWYNTGMYLPDYVMLEPDTALVFKLKYATCDTTTR